MIGAVVVLYHPHPTQLECLLKSLNGQVERVVVVDNTPGLSATMAAFLDKFPYPVSYLPLGDNKGIGEAHNIGILENVNHGCSHVLLLDQDSALSCGMVNKLIDAEGVLLEAGIKVAAVGPRYVDENTGVASFAVRYCAVTVLKTDLDPISNVPVETDILIASGSIIRTSALQSVGMMRDDLFIDLVDTEWALRARSKGYKCYLVPNAIMRHSIGDTAAKIFGRSIYFHSDVRKYYRLRNAVYLLRLSSMGWRWKSYILRWIPYFLFLNLYTAKKKLPNALLLLNAFWDGLLGRLGPAHQWRTPSGTILKQDGLFFR